VADGFLAGAGGVDGFEGEGDFDEFLAVGHIISDSLTLSLELNSQIGQLTLGHNADTIHQP
jgi:hypothetical protein